MILDVCVSLKRLDLELTICIAYFVYLLAVLTKFISVNVCVCMYMYSLYAQKTIEYSRDFPHVPVPLPYGHCRLTLTFC